MPARCHPAFGLLCSGISLLALTLGAQTGALAQSAGAAGLRGGGSALADGPAALSGAAPLGELPVSGAAPPAGLRPAGGETSLAPNYGKPKKRVDPRTRYAGQRGKPGHPLPPLAPYASPAAARQLRAAPPQIPELPPSASVASIPGIPAKARPRVDDDPYAALGVPIGSLRMTPYIEADGGYDSNPNRSPAPLKGSPTLRTEAGAAVKSDWSSHELKGDFAVGYTKYTSVPEANRPDARGKANLRIDVTRDSTLDFELRGQLDTQRPGSPDLGVTNVKNRPFIATVGISAGGAQKFGDLELGVHASVDRTAYQDASLTNGTKLILNGDSFNTYGLRGRAGYQISPGITPFVEVGADVRRRDQPVDSAGFSRDSTGATAKVGTTFELTRQLTGEAAAGYAQRKYEDARLQDLRGPTFDASLVWAATPLTTVSLKGVTALNETTLAGASGALYRAATLDVSHAFMRNLTGSAFATLGSNAYQGAALRETTLSAGLRAEYKLNRSLSVRGSFTHERLHSTAPGSDYTANVFLLGLKFQR